MTIATIYAHQGGWDEILLVAGPIAVIVLVLIVAQRRAIKQRAQSDANEPAELPESD
jgi:Ni/Fe-hydrogenase subunit HybB-like protein